VPSKLLCSNSSQLQHSITGELNKLYFYFDAYSGYFRFIQPLQTCDISLTDMMGYLQPDPWPVAQDKRLLQSAGVALSLAISLLEVSTHACVLTSNRLIGGDRAVPGWTMHLRARDGEERKDTIRSHIDLEKGAAKFSKKKSLLGTIWCIAE